MKRILLISLSILTMTFLCSSGCGKEPSQPEQQTDNLSVSTSSISVSYEKVVKDITITSNCDWGISADDKSWVSVTPGGGTSGTSTVKVSISENPDKAARETKIVVRYGSGNVTIPVKQGYKVEAVNIADKNFLKALLDSYDTDKDGILSTVEAAAITTIKANKYGIKDMSELCSLFPKITSLDCADNDLETLDISVLYDLKHLDCTGNANLKKILVWSGFQAPEDFKKPDGAEYVEPEINTPQGYKLVWQDEFSEGSVPDSKKWTHEVKNSGWVNNELQNYVSGKTPKGQRVTEIVDGKLHINCLKEDGKVYSGRIYGNVKTGWKYGYVEASICLPSGKGTWPAFWMMPVNFKSWPHDGEIDIMEEVGYHKDYVSSSLHADGHVHSNNTQVTKEVYCKGAEGEFHTYGMEWTPDYFQFYVDGKKTLYYKNPGTGVVDWPYDAPFYVILNLAWGGSWGGAQGVNEAVLPVTMKVDYVRVFQKL